MGSEGTMGKGAVIGGDVVVYEEKKGRVRLKVRLEGETVWLSLDVGYRVNSKRGTQFRIWATRTLRERSTVPPTAEGLPRLCGRR
jgi:hypothetical protein